MRPVVEKGKFKVTLALFAGFGIELEYALVNTKTLEVQALAGALLEKLAGEPANDVDLGKVGVSNELVAHQIELKNEVPVSRLESLVESFSFGVQKLNDTLAFWGAQLMPGGMHPWMDPSREVRLWQGDYHEVYACYDRLFNAHSHGLGNVQSAHLNVSFSQESEFVALHSAARLLLPLLPALAASSPFSEGKVSPYWDTRLYHYSRNQSRVPSISGEVIPEPIDSWEEYQQKILQPLYREISPLDPEGLLQYEWLNSRGAIARFERHALEIRLLDTQECVQMDLAVSACVVAVLRALVAETWCSQEEQRKFPQKKLVELLALTQRSAELAVVEDSEYLRCWGISDGKLSAQEIWCHLVQRVGLDEIWASSLQTIFSLGTLSSRLRKAAGVQPDRQKIREVYIRLCDCLRKNQAFIP